MDESFLGFRSAPDSQAFSKYFTRLAELITSPKHPTKAPLSWAVYMDKLELRLSLYMGVRGYWPDPPVPHSLNPTCKGTSSSQQTPRELYAPRRNGPGCRLCASHQETHLAHAGHYFTATYLVSAKCVEPNQGVLEHAGLSPVPFCCFSPFFFLFFALAVYGTVTRGGVTLWRRCLGAH